MPFPAMISLLVSDCSHFSWTSDKGGTCWMKSGQVEAKDAYPTGDEFMICGIKNQGSHFSKHLH